MDIKLKNKLLMAFFLAYALLMLWEGVISRFVGSQMDWFLLFFPLGLGLAIWSHKKSGIIAIALLFGHTTLEMLSHGFSWGAYSAMAMIVFAIHFCFDCGFLWTEMKHHVKSPKRVFVFIVIIYILSFGSSALLITNGTGFSETIEGTQSLLIGGIFGCVASHLWSMYKKFRIS